MSLDNGEHYIRATEAKLWTTASGNGVSAIMFNGGPGCDDYLAPVARLIDHRCRVIRFEPRGCGRSDWDGRYDLATLLADTECIRQAYGVERWLLLGHSHGPNLALAYALKHPARTIGIIGIAGGKEKCNWLVSELGFDAAVDYKSEPVFKALKAAAPNGIDVYFDNVGGDIFEACLPQMNQHGRISCCGAVSAYDGTPPAHGPRGVPGLIVVKRLTVQGFIFTDFNDQREAALADLQSWVKAGKIKVQEDIITGLENTPQALIGLLAGENRGKRMVKI